MATLSMGPSSKSQRRYTNICLRTNITKNVVAPIYTVSGLHYLNHMITCNIEIATN